MPSKVKVSVGKPSLQSRIAALDTKAGTYVALREDRGRIDGEMKELAAEMKDVVIAVGIRDEKGNVVVETPKHTITQQRRVSTSLNEEALTKLLKAKGLYARVAKTVVTFDEEEITRLVHSGEITVAEAKAVIEERESFALTVHARKAGGTP